MKLRYWVPTILTLTLLSVSGFPQQRALKVLLLYDMEGITGVTTYKHTSFAHKPEYEEARISLTADVNAAIAGLKAGGATEIVVVDGHGSGNTTSPDVLEDQLLAPAKMISRDRSFDIYMDSYDHSIDAIVAVGMHAGAGVGSGFLSHTYTFEDTQYKVNGVPFNETMILAMGAARVRIPLITVCGDDQLEKEIRRNLPWVKYAAVKHAVSRTKAEPFARDEVSRRIENAAKDGLLALESARLPEIPGPYRFALSFQDEAQARNAALLPGAEPLADATVVQIRAHDFEEGYRQSLRLISLAGIVARGTAAQAVVNAQPNAASLRLGVTDWQFERWLNLLPPASPSSGGAGAQRFWGAR
ncbi:MAG: M55 family metallopeptidase [Acidobacteriia bacterium]|nr:M55 family metallopeptidase [Terriglobia bacterium]